MSCQRKVEYRLYPRVKAELEVARMADTCRQVFNWALAERIAHYESTGKSLGFAAQCRALTQERKLHPAWQAVHTHALQLVLKRLDFAFGAFFRRLKAGEKPGFPRFKSKHRCSGFGFKEHGNGWRLRYGLHRRQGGLVTPEARAVQIAGIGQIPLRGVARTAHGTPKTAEIINRAGKWYLSVTYTYAETPKRARSGHLITGLDWGVQTFATVANNDGTDARIDNPRHLKQRLDALAAAQQALARKAKGSKRRHLAKQVVARIHARVANQRKNFLHQTTAKLVLTRQAIAVEKLSVQRMVETPREGELKARQQGLNREILAASAGAFHQMLRYKAEEAGTVIVEVDPREHKPSQTCSGGGIARKKSLSERWHVLPDGSVIDRDLNAARNLLNIALGREPHLAREPGQHSGPKTTSDTGCETSSRAA